MEVITETHEYKIPPYTNEVSESIDELWVTVGIYLM